MDIKYELGILKRNLEAKKAEYKKTIMQQTVELNKIKGDHICELQGLNEDDINERLRVIRYQKLEVNEKTGKHIQQLQKSSKEIREYTKRVDDFCKFVEYYSHFDSKEIGEILAEILSTLKGKEYIYQETLRYTAEIDGNGKRVPLVIPYRIIIEKKLAHDSYLDDNIDLDVIISCEMAIVLGINQLEKTVCFYQADEKNHDLNVLVNLDEELVEFIDFLIEYKFTNKLKSIPKDKMTELMEGFIKSKQVKDEKRQLVKNKIV